MNADVNITFKGLLMDHTIKLDDVYYDKNPEKSRNKLLEILTHQRHCLGQRLGIGQGAGN